MITSCQVSSASVWRYSSRVQDAEVHVAATLSKRRKVYAGEANVLELRPQRVTDHRPTPRTRALVAKLAASGITEVEVAALMNYTLGTLKEHYAHELVVGPAAVNRKVGESLYRKAVKGDTAAGIWISKARMGWKALEAGEDKPGGGGTVNVQVVFVAPGGDTTVRGAVPHQREAIDHEQADGKGPA